VSQYQRLLAKFSDCSCDWQMGKKSRKDSKAERDSEEEESATSQMSGTSSEKRRLAETREMLREANREALRLAAGAAAASKRQKELATPTIEP